MHIVLDPGHGGKDPGALGPNGTQEKAQTLWLALMLRMELERYGHTAYLTRWDDKELSLQRRCDIANKEGADVFVSLHFNGHENPQANGCETYHFPSSGTGQRLARHVQTEMLYAVRNRDRGVKAGNFYVLRHTSMTAILVEPTFLTNYEEEMWSRDTKNLAKLSAGIARGIQAYFDEEENDGSN